MTVRVRKSTFGNAVKAGLSGKLRVFGLEASAMGGNTHLQAGPAVALWGDDRVQEGVRMCFRAQERTSVRPPGAFRLFDYHFPKIETAELMQVKAYGCAISYCQYDLKSGTS